MRSTAEVFGLRDNHVAFLSHCGSRGFGNILAQRQFKSLEGFFRTWGLLVPCRRQTARLCPARNARGGRVSR
jgi:tRNA-splicing ligase RtcB (3'-phosphate/5'-hydroxy nucleic acid ligase)